MKKPCRIATAVSLFALFCIASTAGAATIVFTPSPAPPYYDDSTYLFESYYYTWGIDLPSNMNITSASLNIYNLSESTGTENRLFVNLLNTAPSGFTRHFDLAPGTIFDDSAQYAVSNGIPFAPLVTYVNVPTAPPADHLYTFSGAQLTALNLFAADGRFAIGFDSDCYFQNSGIELVVTAVPEPGPMLLLGTGLIGIAGWGRKKFRR